MRPANIRTTRRQPRPGYVSKQAMYEAADVFIAAIGTINAEWLRRTLDHSRYFCDAKFALMSAIDRAPKEIDNPFETLRDYLTRNHAHTPGDLLAQETEEALRALNAIQQYHKGGGGGGG